MNGKEQAALGVQKGESLGLPYCQVLRWWWWWWLLVLLVCSWSAPRCSAQFIPGNLQHGYTRHGKSVDYIKNVEYVKNLQRTAHKESARCPDEAPLRLHKTSNCISEKSCKTSKYVVHWMTRQCLPWCPKGYINYTSHCSFTDVCGTVRIGSQEKLNSLKNCRIVEGSIEIFQIRYVSEDDWKKWTFPDLVEITDFLLVYQVQGLVNLGQLFPNLAVIRGMKLLQHYSLIIYDTYLEVIGLHNLRAILRGSVRIEKNVNLCYVHTVNWGAIVHGPNDNVLTDNSESLCKNCCPSCSIGWSQKSSCPYCWSSNKQQEICSSNCLYACMAEADDQCCHEQCVGGCSWPENDYACLACRYYNSGDRCVDTCPKDLLEYKGYRCVSRNYCQKKQFYQFNGVQCVSECPEGYQRSKTAKWSTCEKCKEGCAKPCQGLLVNTVARAQELRDCTTISGSLIISIRYGKTVTKELEFNLGKIKRVTHHVRIFKTSPLKSLNFLSNLTVIDGVQLYNNKYALYVHENANLEEIWDFNNHTKLNIIKGKIFFHANPKLCYYNKIEKLLNMAGQEEDFSMQLTNGNKVACSIMKHAISLEPQSFSVVVRWTPVSTNEDDRKIMGYFIYYKETNETNIGHMDGRDACNDEWIREHAEGKDSNSTMEVTITNLEPYRHYAVYVETDTVADADIGARSNITYTITRPYNPSRPLNLRVTDKGATYIAVAWSPPRSPNGEIHDYIVSITLLLDTEDACQDFCKMEQIHSEETEESEKDLSDIEVNGVGSTTAPPPKCCPCPEELPPTFKDDEIEFERILQNHTYVHRTSRRKRSIEPADSPAENLDKSFEENFSNPLWTAQYTEYQQETHTAEIDVWRIMNNTFNFTQLSHYTQYKIKVSACQGLQYDCPNNITSCEFCSSLPGIIVETTATKDHANVVVGLNVREVNQSTLEVTWAPPISPNGQVLAYKLSVFSTNKHTKPFMDCLSSCEFNRSQKYHLDLAKLTPATTYLLKVQAYTRAPKDINDAVATTEFETKFFAERQAEDHRRILMIPVIFLLLVMVFGVFMLWRVRPSKLCVKKTKEYPHYHPDPNSVSRIIPKEYEVDPANLRLEESSPLGQGNFGIVFKGHLYHGFEWIPVAVKQTINLPYQEDMLLEAKLMLELESCHIVHAYGVMFGPSHTYLVMEYMSKGDLLKYLRKQERELKIEQVCDMALQIADGMAYLATNNYVHRDLAARNCLINDDMKIKISDFGMTRITEENYYRICHSKPFPVRWLAPECFTKQKFTSQSDVWSYGIVLWEILTLGKTPYQDLSTNDEVRDRVSNGHTLMSNVRSHTDKWLADLICWCWESEGHDRPSFPKIISILLPHASPHFIQLFRLVSFYHQSRGQE